MIFVIISALLIGINNVCTVTGRHRVRGTDQGSLASLLENYPFNKYLMHAVPKPFEVIEPKLVTKHGLEPVSTRSAQQPPHQGIIQHVEQVTIQISIDKKKHKLKLFRNDMLFSSGVQVKHFLDEQKEVITKGVEHCYYQGTVKRDEWSAVALSTCNGVRGVIQVNNETYILQPLAGGQEGMDRSHILYKATRSENEKCGNDLGKWLPFNELHKGDFIRQLKFVNFQKKRDPDGLASASTKFLKLALVLDHSMYWHLNLTLEDLVEHAALTANIVDMYYKEVKIRVGLTYLEFWNHGDRMVVSEKLRKTMDNFMRYQLVHLRGVDHHMAHFLTRREFENQAVGMAIPDSVCTDRAAGINLNPSYLEPQKGATILSHMIGHNLGIKHDEDGGCICEDEFGCIMSTQVLATPERHSRMFSTCSSNDWHTALNIGIAECLSDKPQPMFPQRCGNKHVERGEECDCGTEQECALTDPCCDPSTCMLKHWAQCRTGICCHNCTYLPSNVMCRETSTDCDVPEFCTGSSGLCPANNYAKDGHPCYNSTGYCMGGVCPTLDKQCQHIWGTDALKAELQCFERFNPTGNFNGHCGKDDSTGSFAKCLPSNIECGLLHCQGGTKAPLYGLGKDSTTTTFSSNGQEYECKTVHGPSTLALPNLGIVVDGTRCGEGRICVNSACVMLTHLEPLACPGTDKQQICSGHGVCTKEESCYCEEGWTGEDCSQVATTPRVIVHVNSFLTTVQTPLVSSRAPQNVSLTTPRINRSTSAPATAAVVKVSEEGWMNTKWMMIILAAVIGGLAVILALSFLCYRRRSPGKPRKKAVQHCDEGEAQSANRLIKFGSLPSYREEKKKNKKKKKPKKEQKLGDESDLEKTPIPVILSDLTSKPEKGILKGNYGNLKYMNERRSSESNTATSSGPGDQDSVGPYDEIDEDTEAGEIQDIFTSSHEPNTSLDALDNMVESSSFDFMLPQPFGNIGLENGSPSPHKKFTEYDIPMSEMTNVQRPTLWKTSPPKSRVLRMRNLDELLQTIDRNTIDLSPSPDDPPVQISPSTSEDVRSSSTEDRTYPGHDPQSPGSLTSGSTCTALRPLLGSQWSKYVLYQNTHDPSAGTHFNFEDMESPLPHINIPPPMNPINIRSIFNYGHKGGSRDTNDTPNGSQNGECSSNNGTANSRNGCEKSSGYGSEHDAERYSIEDVRGGQSRCGSSSPPAFSSVIRTGPHQIKLIPAAAANSYNPMDSDLQKLLDGVPRINAGCYERSPLTGGATVNSVNDTCSSVTSGTSTLETLKNSINDYPSCSMSSETNTLVNSDCNSINPESIYEEGNVLCEGLRALSEKGDTNAERVQTDAIMKHPLPELPYGILPNPKRLADEVDLGNKGGGQCIDRSVEEIPPVDSCKRDPKLGKSTRLSVFDAGSIDINEGSHSVDDNKYCEIEPVAIDSCEC